MAGPWERFGSAAPAPEPAEPSVQAGDGPWARFARETAQPRIVPLESPTAVPVWMRGNPGIEAPPDNGATPPSRDIPRTTTEQREAREPEANLGDWLRYLSGLSFVMDSLPGAIGDPGGQRRTNELMARISNAVTGANAQPGVGELIFSNGNLTPADSNPWLPPVLNPEWRENEGRVARTGLGFFLHGDEDARAQIVRNNFPDAQFRRDERGYLQVRLAPTEDWTYLNRPGVSGTDFSDIISVLAKYMPAARVSAIPSTLGGRALAAFGTSAGTEYGAQSLAQTVGGPEPRLEDALVAGAFGTGGQLLGDLALGVLPAAWERIAFSTPGSRPSALSQVLDIGAPQTGLGPQADAVLRSTQRAARQSHGRTLPDPATAEGEIVAPPPSPPAARPDVATRGTPEEIAALEDELATLRQRGPRGTIDPNDQAAVRTAVRADEQPVSLQRETRAIQLERQIPQARTSAQGNALRQEANELRAANKLDDLERRLAAAKPAERRAINEQMEAIRRQYPRAQEIREQPIPPITLSAEGGVQAQLARQRHAEEIEALERRIAEARQPYFTDTPTDIPVTSTASDEAINAAFQLVRGQRITPDAGDALLARIEERLHSRVLPNGDTGPATGLDMAVIRQAGDEFANTQNALALVDRTIAQTRAGVGTFRQAQQTRNALRHFETTATSDVDRRALERITLAYDEWLDLAFGTQRATVKGLDDILNASGLVLNQRTASMARRDAPVVPQRPIEVTAPKPAAAPRPATRAEVRSAFDRQRIPASRGQVAQDTRARQREDDLIQSGEPRASRFADEQAAAIERRGTEMATRGQTPLSENVEEAGDVLRRDIQQQFEVLDDLADATYSRAFSLLKDQRVASDSADSLRSAVVQRLERGTGPRDDPMFQYDDTGFRADVITADARNFPQSSAALRQLERLAENVESGTLNYAVVARSRQNLLALARNAEGADMVAIRNIRHGFDEWFNNQLGRQQTFRLFTAADVDRQVAETQLRQEAHALYQEANAIWSERQRIFSQRSGGRDPGGGAMERIRDPRGEITGTQIINSIFSSRGVPTTAAVGALRRIREASLNTLPSGRAAPRGVTTDAARAFEDPNGVLTPAMAALREAFWHRILAPVKGRRAGALVPARATANNLDRALNGEGAAITRLLHTDAEIAQMRELLQVLKYAERPVGVNTSGTAITLRRMLQASADGLASSLPRAVAWVPRIIRVMFGANLDDLARGAEANMRFSRPVLDVTYGATPSGAAMGQVVFDQNNRTDSRLPTRRSDAAPVTDPESGDAPPAGYDPMEGISDIVSYAAGTITFNDGQQWVTLPLQREDGVQMPVSAAITAWRDGTLTPLATGGSQDAARAAAQSYRARTPATVP